MRAFWIWDWSRAGKANNSAEPVVSCICGNYMSKRLWEICTETVITVCLPVISRFTATVWVFVLVTVQMARTHPSATEHICGEALIHSMHLMEGIEDTCDAWSRIFCVAKCIVFSFAMIGLYFYLTSVSIKTTQELCNSVELLHLNKHKFCHSLRHSFIIYLFTYLLTSFPYSFNKYTPL